MEPVAFQDRMPHNHCWGCGADNEKGLRLKSYWEGDEAVAEWAPGKEHVAGPTDVLNGGIIATLLDCHSICTAIANAYREEGREVGEGDPVWCVTAKIEVQYKLPAPIDQPVALRARIRRREGRKTWVDCELSSGGEARASSSVLAVRVR